MSRQHAPTNSLRRHLPNGLTISRVIAIFPIAGLIHFGESSAAFTAALLITLYAIVTDFLDGYLSRRWHVVSDLGRLLDPVADKLLVAVLLIMLCSQGLGHALAVAAIMVRELFVSGLREFMQERGGVIHVSKLAKYKTSSQMLACLLLLISGAASPLPWLDFTANVVLWAAVALTVITGMDYFLGVLRHISGNADAA